MRDLGSGRRNRLAPGDPEHLQRQRERFFAAPSHPTLAKVVEAAAALRALNAASSLAEWRALYARLLRDPWGVRPSDFYEQLAELLEEGEQPRRRGRPGRDWRQDIDREIWERPIANRIDRWRCAVERRKCRACTGKAIERVAEETSLTVEQVRKIWKRRDRRRDRR